MSYFAAGEAGGLAFTRLPLPGHQMPFQHLCNYFPYTHARTLNEPIGNRCADNHAGDGNPRLECR